MKKLICALTLLLLGFTLPAQVKIVGLLTEHLSNPIGLDITEPRFSWQLVSSRRNTKQFAYEIKVYQGKQLYWGTGKINSDASVHVPYAGPALESGAAYQWRVRVWDKSGKPSPWSETAHFQMALLRPENWKAQWIAAAFPEDSINRPAIYFRKEFAASKKIAKATIYLTAHGMYEAQLNGKRIGDSYLAPGWTSYTKRLQYQVYDVTDLVKQGRNVIGATVGNGWYRGYLAWASNKNVFGKELGLLAQLAIDYTDGTNELVISDPSWKSSYGSIRYAEIYHGETIDAREEKTGWALPGYNDAKWFPVKSTGHNGTLVATYNEPIRKQETFKPVRVLTTPKGERVLDYGQNLVGWVMVKARGRAGDKIVLRHAEVLDKAGNFYLDNLRAAQATATYILSGNGEEFFEPHFTFYGFRYLRIEGLTGEINPADFTAVALYSDMKPTGSFSCSEPLLNQLQHNIQWGQRGNFLDVPTDCPQRDERLGWTGDAQAFARTATFNFGVNNFFAKWLKDVAADQLPNGSVPFVIPNVLGAGSAGATGWADCATIIPWDMYLAYGDQRILESQYPSMKAWVGYMEKASKNDLWNTGFHFGDWLFYRPFDDNDGRSAVTDKYLIAQCFYAHSVQLLINTAGVLGNTRDQQYYRDLLQRIKTAFQREYLTPNGRLVSGTQTAYVLALNFDMLPESLRPQMASRLVENIKSYGNHLTTGFLGTPYLCHVLTRFGYTDMAYTLLQQETYPSWLYPVKMGATTIWERWNGIHPDSTFEPASMNSFNHYAYGAIGDWMYRTVAGLDTHIEGVGYRQLRIKPQPGGKLTWAKASLQTYYGLASSAWRKEVGQVIYDIEVPCNATATILLPVRNASLISENGRPVSSIQDIALKGSEDGYTILVVGSGKYSFAVRD